MSSKLTLTLRVDNETTRNKYPQYGNSEQVTETETLCNIEAQHFSKGMLAAALRQLADEIEPPVDTSRFQSGSPF